MMILEKILPVAAILIIVLASLGLLSMGIIMITYLFEPYYKFFKRIINRYPKKRYINDLVRKYKKSLVFPQGL